MKYSIEIEEICTYSFEVEANSKEEAEKIAIEKYETDNISPDEMYLADIKIRKN